MKKICLIPFMLLIACSDDKEIIKEFESQLHHSYPFLSVSNIEINKISANSYQLKGDLIITEDMYETISSVDKRIIDESSPLAFIKKTKYSSGEKIPFSAQFNKGEMKYHIRELKEYNDKFDSYIPLTNHFGNPLNLYKENGYQVYFDSRKYNTKIRSVISHNIQYKDDIQNKINSTIDSLTNFEKKEEEIASRQNKEIKELNNLRESALAENEKLMDNYRTCLLKTNKINSVSGYKNNYTYKGKIITSSADCSDIYLEIENLKNKIIDTYKEKEEKIKQNYYSDKQVFLSEKEILKKKNEQYIAPLREKIEHINYVLSLLESKLVE